MISPYKFTWQGRSSLDFDLWSELSFDGDSGEQETHLRKVATYSEGYNGLHIIHNYKNDDILSFNITLIKQDYSDITPEENRQILKWLSSSYKPAYMNIYLENSDVIYGRAFGNIIDIQQYKMANQRVVGYIINFECNSNYLYSPVQSTTKTIVNSQSFIVQATTDEPQKYIMPKITITFNGENIYLETTENPMVETYVMMENVIYKYNDTYCINIGGQKQTIQGIFATAITSQTADNTTYNNYYYCSYDGYIYKGSLVDSLPGWTQLTQPGIGLELTNTYFENGQTIVEKAIITGNIQNEIITLDSANKLISSSQTPMRIIGNDFNWVFPKLIDGVNNIVVKGNCQITFEWVEPHKTGGY